MAGFPFLSNNTNKFTTALTQGSMLTRPTGTSYFSCTFSPCLLSPNKHFLLAATYLVLAPPYSPYMAAPSRVHLDPAYALQLELT